jgi:Uma2 family endonuclease
MAILHVFVREHDLGRVLPGPIDVLFGEGDHLEPDLVFVRSERAHLVSERGIEGAPDLVVEILSPSTAHRDRGIKLERYRHFGVPEYWIVDIDARAVEVWRLGEGAEAAEVLRPGDVLAWTPLAGGPALDIPVDEVLAGV